MPVFDDSFSNRNSSKISTYNNYLHAPGNVFTPFQESYKTFIGICCDLNAPSKLNCAPGFRQKKFLGGNSLFQQERNSSPAPIPIVCPCIKISHGYGCGMGMGKKNSAALQLSHI